MKQHHLPPYNDQTVMGMLGSGGLLYDLLMLQIANADPIIAKTVLHVYGCWLMAERQDKGDEIIRRVHAVCDRFEPEIIEHMRASILAGAR